MADRVCIFVDSENFRYSIESLFENFDRSDYLPKLADWTALFNWVTREATEGGLRIRTYWYVIQSVDFYPYRFPRGETDRLYRLLHSNPDFRRRLDSLQQDDLNIEMKRIVDELEESKSRFLNRFNAWTNIQNGISQRHRAVEFRRAGSITYNLFERRLQREKAVDVKLATDLIMLRDIYDVAIIVSGDQDYVPAVQAVKDSGKRVINVAFLRKGGGLLPGGARRLNEVTDWSLNIKYEDLGPLLGL